MHTVARRDVNAGLSSDACVTSYSSSQAGKVQLADAHVLGHEGEPLPVRERAAAGPGPAPASRRVSSVREDTPSLR